MGRAQKSPTISLSRILVGLAASTHPTSSRVPGASPCSSIPTPLRNRSPWARRWNLRRHDPRRQLYHRLSVHPGRYPFPLRHAGAAGLSLYRSGARLRPQCRRGERGLGRDRRGVPGGRAESLSTSVFGTSSFPPSAGRSTSRGAAGLGHGSSASARMPPRSSPSSSTSSTPRNSATK